MFYDFQCYCAILFQRFCLKFSESNSQFSMYLGIFIVGLIYTLISVAGLWLSRKRYPKSLNIEKNENGSRTRVQN